MPMNNPPHTRLSVRHDCLEPLNISVTEVAQQLGVRRKQLSDIVTAKLESHQIWQSVWTRHLVAVHKPVINSKLRMIWPRH